MGNSSNASPPSHTLVGQLGQMNRRLLRPLAVVLLLLCTLIGSWLTLDGIGAASFDLAMAKWVNTLSLFVLLGHSLWGTIGLHGKASLPGTLAATTTALLISGAYVLVGYSLHFGSRYYPWYNGLIGLNGLLLLALASVVYLEVTDIDDRGQEKSRLVASLAVITLLFAASFDFIPRAA